MGILFLAQTVTVLLGFVRENVWTSILTLSIIEQRLRACQRIRRLTERNYHAFFLKSKVAMRILSGSSLNLSRYSLSYSIGDPSRTRTREKPRPWKVWMIHCTQTLYACTETGCKRSSMSSVTMRMLPYTANLFFATW